MSDVFNGVTKEFLTSVHTPDYIGKSEWVVIDKDYLESMDLPKCAPKFWKVSKGIISEMTSTEKNAVLSSEVKNELPTLMERIAMLESKV